MGRARQEGSRLGNWLMTQIVNAIMGAFQNLVVVPIGTILKYIVGVVFWLITQFLKATVFAPLSLDPLHPGGAGGQVAAAAAEAVWGVMAAVSVAVALFALAWAAFTNTWGSFAGRSQFQRGAWADVMEGVGIWVLVLVAGREFLIMLLNAMNSITQALISVTQQYQWNWAGAPSIGGNLAHGLSAIGVAIITYWFWPSALLVLGGFMLWAVIIWAMRIVDLIVFTGLLPVTAALAITGNKRAWQWNWAEAMGAVFSQLAMVLMWWIAWLIIGGNLNLNSGNFIVDIIRLLIGIFAMFLVGKAPQMLQQITGHSHAGIGGMMMAAAGGYMLGKGAMSAARMTPLGQAVDKTGQAVTQRSQQKLAHWADKPPVGSGPMAQGFMQKATQAGKAVLGAVGATGAGQVVSGAANQMWAGLQTKAPGVASAMRAAGGATASGARAAGGVGRAVLQPNRALGQTALRADSLKVDAAVRNVGDNRAVNAGAVGVDEAMRLEHLDPNNEEQRRQFVSDVMTAPHGANRFRQARETAVRKGMQPRRTVWN